MKFIYLFLGISILSIGSEIYGNLEVLENENLVEEVYPLITEDKLKEIIENAKNAPKIKEDISTNNQIFLEKRDKFYQDIGLLNGFQETFDKYDISKKSSDLYVGHISSEEIVSPNIIKNGEVGVGINYESSDGEEDERRAKEKSGYIPIYATGKYVFSQNEKSSKYLKVNLGYSFEENDDRKNPNELNEDMLQTGIYYGIGGGVSFEDISFNLLYQTKEDEKQGKDNRIIFSIDYDLE